MSLLKQTEKFLNNSELNDRKKKGQYFTPKIIKDAALDQIDIFDGAKILENSCGTGEFIYSILERNKNVDIDAYDIDPTMVAICQNQFPSVNSQVYNFLELDHKPIYDYVIGNPPYFEYLKENMSETIRNKFDPWLYGRPNIYALFIKASIDCLVEGGKLVFVVPKSINNGQHFKKFREFIIENCNILNMSFYNANMFKNAQQEVMVLVLEKLKNGESNNGEFLFYKKGMDCPIFTLYKNKLEREFKNSKTLGDLGFKVSTGNFVWNQNKKIISRNRLDTKLIWACNVVDNKLKLDIPRLNKITLDKNPRPQFQKGQYVSSTTKITPLFGKSIVLNRVVGTSKSNYLRAAIIDYDEEGYYVENHLNVITKTEKATHTIEEVYKELIKPEKVEMLKMITGNTQLSAKELENLIPINIGKKMITKNKINSMVIKTKKIRENAVIPTYAKQGDAAVDLYAAYTERDKYGNHVYFTGLCIEIPSGFVGLLYPRSSVSKTSMALANSVGVVDSGYRGEIMFKYRQTGEPNPIYRVGDRVGQLMIIPYPEIEFIEADELSTTERGEGGFGSTGS